jgi:glycosyltransferase involved in cell wall biosynthesis
MIIGIDARVLERKISGIGRYLFNILAELPNYDKKNSYILISKSELKIRDSFYRKLSTGNNLLPPKIYSPIWLNFVLPKYLKREKIDVFFTPNHLVPLRKLNGTKTIIVVHDVFHKINKNFHPKSYALYINFFLFNSLKKSDLIITVSHNSKRDIQRIYNIPEKKIRVIYEYVDESFRPMQISDYLKNSIINEYKLPSKKFMLYVGSIENRKNVLGILKIGDILYKKKIDLDILLVGKRGFKFRKIYKQIKKRNDYVKYLSYVDDETLKKIYNMATLFIFPSYYEGFGLTPLEAMQSGVPVLASNTSSLKEVVGEGGILHEPDNHEAFASDIERLLNDSEFYKEMKKKALLQARNFDKEKSLGELLKIFESY